jgi:hypothetical protein
VEAAAAAAAAATGLNIITLFLGRAKKEQAVRWKRRRTQWLTAWKFCHKKSL